MVSAEEHPGIFYFMVGMVVLVMAGVGLSLLVDRRMKSSSGISDAQRDVAMGEEELESLRAYHADRSFILQNYGSKMKSGLVGQKELRQQLVLLNQRQSKLEATRSELSAAIPLLQDEFSRYRAEYRRQAWSGAAGEKLGTLTIRGGREYQDAAITRVTDVGIEIRHKDGIARIQAPDLGAKWQDRFQWSDEERRARLNQELADHQRIASDSPPETITPAEDPPVRGAVETAPHKNDADPTELRTQVIAWRSKVSRLTFEKSEAQSQASYGSQSSVGGSLETWRAKSARLTGELAKARAALSIAKSRLAEVSPNDPLLRTAQGELRDN